MALFKAVQAAIGKSCLRRIGGWVVLLCLLNLGGCRVSAATGGLPEYDVKAAFLFNFARFVEWPETALPLPNEPWVIGIVGEDPFGATLEGVINGEQINGRRLIVKQFARKDDLTKCQVLYISRSETAHLAEILERVKNRPILTVSDTDGFASSGGTIGLVMEQGKVRIQINLDRAKTAQLAISAKLLRPATVIRDKPQSMLPRSWDWSHGDEIFVLSLVGFADNPPST